MSTMVFKLRYVPDDEAQEVRAVLDEHHVEYYETTAGNWGIAMPGLWVQDPDVQRARELIGEYQLKRSTTLREEYNQAAERGERAPWYAVFINRPLAAAGTVLFCLFIVYAMLSPFVRLALSP